MLSAGRKQVTDLSVKTLVNYVKNGKVTFDNAIQRSAVWDTVKKSQLIYSVLSGIEIPSFNCNKIHPDLDNLKKFTLDLLDGKQRTIAFSQFLNNEFPLTGIDDVTVESLDGGEDEELNLNTNYFDDLPQELKDIITGYKCRFITYDDMSFEETCMLFGLLNNGVSLTKVELNRVQCPCFDTIYRIAKHELFTTCLTEKAIDKYKNEDIIFKSIQMLTAEKPCLDTKVMTPFIQSLQVDEAMEQRLNRIYDRMMNVYNMIAVEMEDTTDKDVQKMNKKILRKISSQTHIISLARIVDKSLELGMTDEQYKEFIFKFFGTSGRECSISSRYNACLSGGSGHADKVAYRDSELFKVFDEFVKSIVISSTVNEETEEVAKEVDSNEEENVVATETEESTEDTTDIVDAILNAMEDSVDSNDVA